MLKRVNYMGRGDPLGLEEKESGNGGMAGRRGWRI
jgi:hypothetical protein